MFIPYQKSGTRKPYYNGRLWFNFFSEGSYQTFLIQQVYIKEKNTIVKFS